MKVIAIRITALLISVLVLANNQAQGEDVSEPLVEEQVLRTFNSLADAAADLDFDRYIAFFDETTFTGLNADGTVWRSLGEFSASVRPGFDAIEKVLDLRFPVIKITLVDPQTAILVNEYEQQMLMRSGEKLSVSGGGTQVWSKVSGSWRLVSVSASSK